MSVLVVQHQETCPPGRVGEWLTANAVELDVRKPYAGESLPTDLRDHDGLLVLGGEMGCRDDDVAPWLPAVRDLVVTAAKGATPTLGICLGHQLATVALGSDVGRNPAGRTVGMFTVDGRSDLADDPVLAGAAPAPVVQWNDDVVARLPSGATALATNERGDLLLARLAPTVWAVQGHPRRTARSSSAGPRRTSTPPRSPTSISRACSRRSRPPSPPSTLPGAPWSPPSPACSDPRGPARAGRGAAHQAHGG